MRFWRNAASSMSRAMTAMRYMDRTSSSVRPSSSWGVRVTRVDTSRLLAPFAESSIGPTPISLNRRRCSDIEGMLLDRYPPRVYDVTRE
jgi:hypothetical protein